MAEQIRQEIDQNYDFFQRNLASLLTDHAGQYALLRSRKIIDFFEKPGDAFRAGMARFEDRIFSVQRVTDEPVEVGMFSIALA